MKIEKISKRINRMSREQLTNYALSSIPNAQKAIGFLMSDSKNTGLITEIFNKISHISKMVNDNVIKNAIIKMLPYIPPESVATILNSLLAHLNPNSLTDAEQLMLFNLSLNNKRVKAILVMQKNVPPNLVNKIFFNSGFIAKQLQDDIKKQDELLLAMQHELENGTPWENNQSGIILGLRLFKNQGDQYIHDFINIGNVLPNTLVNAVNKHGTNEMKQSMAQKLPSLTNAIKQIKNSYDDDAKVAIMLSFFENPYVNADKKSRLMEWAVDALPKAVTARVIDEFSLLPYEETFITAIDLLRKNQCYSVNAITSNTNFSTYYMDVIQKILFENNLLHMANPSFVNEFRNKQDILEITQEQPEEYEDIFP